MTLTAERPCLLGNESELRTAYKPPNANVLAKDIGRIDQHFRRFIELSPFVCMGTSGPDRSCDVSPRGGEPGFVHVLDETTLAMPDRPGNNRLDSLTNIVSGSGVGLLFLIPGFGDTLRVNGVARISTDPALVERFRIDGKAPLSVIVIEVKEIYLHCPKALVRSRLWDPEARQDREAFPSAGTIYRDQLALKPDATAIDAVLDQDTRDILLAHAREDAAHALANSYSALRELRSMRKIVVRFFVGVAAVAVVVIVLAVGVLAGR